MFHTVNSSLSTDYLHHGLDINGEVPTIDLGARALPDAARIGSRLTMPRLSEHYVFFLDVSGVMGDRDDLAINGDVDSLSFGLRYHLSS